ncbi:MAG: hypothetical protein HZB46_09270 [Solirubrobacterales bacterium]|nr:hypothetical protein [Solirubrobacterales bacterium]
MPDVLRPGVLDGVTACVAGCAGERLAELGATVVALEADLADEDATIAAAAALPRPGVLVVDTAAAFGDGGMAGLRAAVDGAWNAVRAVVNAHFLEGGGKVVLVAPSTGEHATAAGAALENTARTVSVEWARLDIRTTAIRPAPGTTAEEVAELAAFLASPAGDYYSGCAFSMTS